MTETTNNLKLPLLIQSQANKELCHNEALIIIDAILNNGIKLKDLTEPPETYSTGDLFLIGNNATGIYTNHDNQLTFYYNGWHFLIPRAGMLLFSIVDAKLMYYNESSWKLIENGLPNEFDLNNMEASDIIVYDGTTNKWINSKILQNLVKLGIGTMANDDNKLAVASPYILFNNNGNSCQLKINKNTLTDSSSLLFQSNWTGYAEFGLVGDNEFALKISNDGNNWTEVFKCDGATGRIFFKTDTETTGVLGDIKTTVSSVNYDHGYWLKLNTTARNISRTQYSKLFEKIGTSYGTGDGKTTFGLPTYNTAGSCGFIFTGQW